MTCFALSTLPLLMALNAADIFTRATAIAIAVGLIWGGLRRPLAR